MNEDIITSLKNAINSGEPMETAMQILVNSGYDPREVKEASRFVGQGVISDLHPSQNAPMQSPQSIQAQQPPSSQVSIQPINENQPQLNQQPMGTSHQQIIRKKSHTKEIILVIILIFLMGILGATIFFKDKILSYLS